MRGRRSGPTAAAAALAALVAVLLLVTACGAGAGDPTGGDGSAAQASPVVSPSASSASSASASASAAPAPRAQVLDVVGLPLAGEETDPVPEAVTLPTEATAYAARFPSSARASLRAAIDGVDVPPGLDLRAAVVLVGCQEPADVLLDNAGTGGWTVRAVPPKPTVQCLVPVTYVALVGVPS